MSKKSDLIKQIVKKDGGEKPSFGTDPRDPWSTKANITETALLNRYLKSRGINPQFASKDVKVAHSKTNQFKIWMRAHIDDPIREAMSSEHTPTEKRSHALKRSEHVNKEIRVAGANKQLHSEAVDKEDVVSLNIPFLIRVLELAREDLKSDMDLHRVVEKLISIRNKGVLTMDDYNTVAKIKESVEQFVESFPEYGEYADVISEISSETLDSYKAKAKVSADKLTAQGQHKKSADRWLNVMKATGKQIDKTTAGIKKALNRENLEPQAADHQPWDCANNPDDTIPAKRSTAQKVKLLLGGKKNVVKEDMYDHEKEDKSVATYGKKPKLQNPVPDTETKKTPPAAAVLTGGKTLTGEPRDTIEIDPMMKTKKDALDSQKPIK